MEVGPINQVCDYTHVELGPINKVCDYKHVDGPNQSSLTTSMLMGPISQVKQAGSEPGLVTMSWDPHPGKDFPTHYLGSWVNAAPKCQPRQSANPDKVPTQTKWSTQPNSGQPSLRVINPAQE